MEPSQRELQDAIEAGRRRGLAPRQINRELAKRYPGITVAQVKAAVEALAEETAYALADAEEDLARTQQMMRLIARAEKTLGRKGLTARQALQLLARRGDAEAKTLLDEAQEP